MKIKDFVCPKCGSSSLVKVGKLIGCKNCGYWNRYRIEMIWQNLQLYSFLIEDWIYRHISLEYKRTKNKSPEEKLASWIKWKIVDWNEINEWRLKRRGMEIE